MSPIELAASAVAFDVAFMTTFSLRRKVALVLALFAGCMAMSIAESYQSSNLDWAPAARHLFLGLAAASGLAFVWLLLRKPAA